MSYIISTAQYRMCKEVAKLSGVQLSKIILIGLPDHLPLQLEGSSDEARLGRPWLWYQFDFGWDLKLLKPSFLCCLKKVKGMSAQSDRVCLNMHDIHRCE
jgi:hypothetical protein